ncbi:hypothetical protein LEP1GSC047_0804 [Leptospira inadai serovar Lyme str. 10]|uniref:Uncharacterized protein n=1 Tax=Leptospira inadai serovar Lyme str. 10 TaxID=1049790 RepID=V6HDC3_9LEPT|nr:hypothetical protein LEP1GSC047_0804 [Leptospira inadai serovar Lyme str. 10]
MLLYRKTPAFRIFVRQEIPSNGKYFAEIYINSGYWIHRVYRLIFFG